MCYPMRSPKGPHPMDDDRDTNGPETLGDVIDSIEHSTGEQERVSIGDIFDAFEGRLFGPMLVVPALALLTPLGGIPGAPIVIAVVLLLIAGQRVAGKTQPWIPRRILEREVERRTLVGAFERVRPWARRIDRLIRPRMHALVRPPMPQITAGIVVLLALAIPVIGLIPFAVAAPGAAILLLGLALTGRDGLLALLGDLVAIASLGMLVYVLV